MTNQNYLEQALHTYGDELYQTALLLTLDQRRAEKVLLKVARSRNAVPSAGIGAVPLIAALLAALPAKQQAGTKLPWAATGPDAPVMAAISRLPVEQRLALDLLLRRDYEPVQIASLFANDPAKVTQALQNGLLALAPVIAPELPVNLLDGIGAPDECQPVRAQLAATPNATLNPLVRSHLATCSACRSAEQAWARLRTEVERVMRGALRTVAMPAPLAERMLAIAAERGRPPLLQRLLRPRVLQIGVPVAVLLIIAVIVMPRRDQTGSNATVRGTSAGQEPRALIQQALDTLYAPSGDLTWHGQYTMRWNFNDDVYATLSGNLWRAPDNRYRIQLTHQDGGAPYEFAMAERNSFWYARTALYGRSIFGPLHEQYANQVRVPLVEEQREPLLQARLDAGAWGVAGNYLRQGLAAESLSTWGRQRGPDGSDYMVVGFRGVSPLGPPPDAPGMPSEKPTVLLTIDTANGRLREVREVSGPTGGEQTSRTVWQMNEDGPVEDDRQLATLFNIEKAYNGGGRFLPMSDPRGAADPALPMVPMSAIQPPTNMIGQWEGGMRLPATPPEGSDRILVLAANPYEQPEVVYLGTGRFLHVTQTNSSNDQIISLEDFITYHGSATDRVDDPKTGNSLIFIPEAGQQYDLFIRQPWESLSDRATVVQISAIGFSRAELLGIANEVAPIDVASYTANVRLFRTPVPHEPAAFEALVGALEQTSLAQGQARQLVERRFSRQGPLAERTADPYHRRIYSEGGEWSENTIWVRRNNGQLETATQQRNDSGEIIQQSFSSAETNSWYTRRYGARYSYDPGTFGQLEPIVEPTWSVINLLGCGGTTLTTNPDGTRVVAQVDEDWYADSCNRSNYALHLYTQEMYSFGDAERPLPSRLGGSANPNGEPDEGPYLIGTDDMPMVHRILINPQGRAYRYEAWAGRPEEGILIEAAETKNELVPLAQANAAFDTPLPEAMIEQSYTSLPDGIVTIDDGEIRRITLTEAITRSTTPLWYIPPDDVNVLRTINSVDTPSWGRWSSDIFDRAVNGGLAIQLVYAPPISDTNRLSQDIYVGEASRFAAFLRLNRSWQSAAEALLVLDGRNLRGWTVTTAEGETWVLFEIDGSLVAIDASTPERAARIGLLQRAELTP